jgi:formylglycine-generating enzyme required for sulfatase activity
VWEWCSSLYKPYPYDLADGREDPQADAARVLRGGAFSYALRNVRCAYRSSLNPVILSYHVGFRLVVAPGL